MSLRRFFLNLKQELPNDSLYRMRNYSNLNKTMRQVRSDVNINTQYFR